MICRHHPKLASGITIASFLEYPQRVSGKAKSSFVVGIASSSVIVHLFSLEGKMEKAVNLH